MIFLRLNRLNLENVKQAQARIGKIRACWEELWKDLARFLCSHEEMRDNLARAGVPLGPDAHGIPRELVRRAYLHASDIRDRYTVLHLARDTGVLDRTADEVLSVLE